jgi:PAS domain S-box-containing protein
MTSGNKTLRDTPATVILFGGLLLAVAAGSLVALRFTQFARRGEAVAATQELAAQTTKLEAQIAELLAAQHGYVLTGGDTYLTSFRTALEGLPTHVHRLRQQTRAPSAQPIVEALARRVTLLMAEAEQTAALRRTLGAEAAAARVAEGTVEAAMDSVRSLLGALQQIHDSLLADQRAVLHRSRRALVATLLGAAVLAVLGFGGGLLVVRRTIRQRLEAEARASESERRASEILLQYGEERYRKVVELNPDGIFIMQDGRIAYANAASLRLLGASSPDDVIGRSPLDFLDPTDHPVVLRRIQQMQEGGAAGSFVEQRFLRVDGTAIDLEIGAAPIPYGDRYAIQVVMRDVTARRSLAAPLE